LEIAFACPRMLRQAVPQWAALRPDPAGEEAHKTRRNGGNGVR